MSERHTLTDPDVAADAHGDLDVAADTRRSGPPHPTPGTPSIGDQHRRASIKARLFGTQQAAVYIGRFRVEGELGRGGMGSVYAAYDEKLGRKVAIKVLHAAADDAAAKGRLLREAQALAQLSHPNVVAVHEVGEHAGRVFVAMEFVRGQNLRAWHQEHAPSIDEALSVYLQAGRGLQAAHAVGLVHRDFKPDNVILGDDGRVRVLDFGLARPVEFEEAMTPRPSSSDADLLRSPMTATGAIMGTPAYMAPEQHRGEAADARSDQFAFCVSLFEALYDERPFPQQSLQGLRDAILTGERGEVPERAGVSPKLRAAIERGLATAPEDRYPDMGALLQALAPVEPRRAILPWAVGGLTALLGVASWAYATRQDSALDGLCKPAVERLAGFWDAEARAELLTHFNAGDPPTYVQKAGEVMAGQYDHLTERWTRAYEAACHDLQQTPNDALVASQRLSCINDFLWRSKALKGGSLSSDPAMWAAQLSGHFPLERLDMCDDPAALRSLPPTPESDAARAHAKPLKAQLSRALALRNAGHLREAQALAREGLAASRAADLPNLIAEFSLAVARAHQALGLPNTAAKFDEAVVAAEAAGSDWHLVDIMVDQGVRAAREGDAERAQQIASRAKVIVERLGRPARLVDALTHLEAAHLVAIGKREEAVALRRKVLGAREADEGAEDPMTTYKPLRRLAETLSPIDHEAALEYRTRAAKLREDRLGPQSPMLAEDLGHVAFQLLKLGRFDAAETQLGRAQAILESAAPEGRLRLAEIRRLQAGLHQARGQLPSALVAIEESIELLEPELGASHPRILGGPVTDLLYFDYARGRDAIVTAHLAALTEAGLDGQPNVLKVRAVYAAKAGEREAADQMLDKALATRPAGLPEATFDIEKRLWRSWVAHADRDHELARRHAEEALTTSSDAKGLAPWQRVDVQVWTAMTRLRTGDAKGARALLEPAVAKLDEMDAGMPFAGDAYWTLARATEQTGGDPARVRALVESATRAYADIGPGRTGGRDDARAWLDAHPS